MQKEKEIEVFTALFVFCFLLIVLCLLSMDGNDGDKITGPVKKSSCQLYPQNHISLPWNYIANGFFHYGG